ncbi:Protein yecM [Salmonella bongori]|nr:Protein yecM [Salmonella bongori]
MIFPQIYRDSHWRSENFPLASGLEIRGLEADHISLRCHQNTTAERWRRGFEQCGELLSENIINGRPICLFKLHEPVGVEHWRFFCH